MLKLYGNSLIDIIPVVYRTRAITRVNRAAKDHQFCRGKKMTAAEQQRKRCDTIWFNPSSSSESDQICCNTVRLVYAAAADSLMFCVHSQTLFILQVIQYISTVDQSTSKTFECEHNDRKRLTGSAIITWTVLSCRSSTAAAAIKIRSIQFCCLRLCDFRATLYL